jgi:hypothetical protein
MRCPGCGADNPVKVKRCAACGERLSRRPPRRVIPDETDSPFARRGEGPGGTALAAYRYGIYSLVPFAGLVLGPVAVVLAVIAWRQGQADPAAKRPGHVMAALFLGTVTLLANGIGLALMAVGLRSAGLL